MIGFMHDPQVLRAYRDRHPQDTTATDLRTWSEFETAYPDTFAGMYRFWAARKRDPTRRVSPPDPSRL
jgi:hypothetical protein